MRRKLKRQIFKRSISKHQGNKYPTDGRIPAGWKNVILGAGIQLISGQHILAENCNEEGEGFLYLTGPADFPEGKIISKKYTEKPAVICASGDILITVKGSGTGKVIRANKPYCISRQLMAVRSKAWDQNFVFHFLKFRESHFEQFASGLIPGIARNDILLHPLLIPPLHEQENIAKTISTWDLAIQKTQETIKIKELRRKALAQQLLTGKKRLSGFSGKWTWVRAGELFESVSQRGNENESLLSVMQDKGVVPREHLEARVTMPSGETKAFKLVIPGNYVVSLRSFQGGIEFSEHRGIVSPAYTVLQAVKPINHAFYRFYFKSYTFIGDLAVSVIGIRDGKQINYNDFKLIKIPFPDLKEQVAIAIVLTTAEKELALLRRKLEALKEQKKGLMQKLLTGQIRVTGRN